MKKKIFSMSVAIAMILGCASFGAYASANDLSIENPKSDDVRYSITEAYQYPISPGTDEWFAIESNAEKVARCQIPEEILAEMTTDALVETVLDYPFLIDLLLFSSNEEGFEAVRDSFNGLQELVNRPDGIDKLYQYSNALKSTYSLDALTEYEIEIILQGAAGEEKDVSFDGELESLQFNDELQGINVIYPRTPSGDTVTREWCIYDQAEMSADARADINKSVKATYGLDPVRQPTTKYNCHSYAWYDRSTSNKWWIQYPDDFIADTYYTENTGLIAKGNIVTYKVTSAGEYTHSGVVQRVSNNNVYVISKWGQTGLYEHSISNVPASYGAKYEFYEEYY